MRQLLVMRHAKSDWDANYQSDHDRPLNERGIRSARLMGRLLSARGLIPGLIISSTALRARTTAELAQDAGGWDAAIQLDRGLYEEGPDGVLDIAAKAPDVARLMLVGHQPTRSGIIATLTSTRIDMKTASVAVIEVEVDDWVGLKGSPASLLAVHHPRSYFGTEWDRV